MLLPNHLKPGKTFGQGINHRWAGPLLTAVAIQQENTPAKAMLQPKNGKENQLENGTPLALKTGRKLTIRL